MFALNFSHFSVIIKLVSRVHSGRLQWEHFLQRWQRCLLDTFRDIHCVAPLESRCHRLWLRPWYGATLEPMTKWCHSGDWLLTLMWFMCKVHTKSPLWHYFVVGFKVAPYHTVVIISSDTVYIHKRIINFELLDLPLSTRNLVLQETKLECICEWKMCGNFKEKKSSLIAIALRVRILFRCNFYSSIRLHFELTDTNQTWHPKELVIYVLWEPRARYELE